MKQLSNLSLSQRINKYSIEYPKSSLSCEQLKIDPNVLVVPKNIDQTKLLVDDDAYLTKVASYIKQHEDLFLGERFDGIPDDLKGSLHIHSSYLSNGIHQDETNVLTFIEFLLVLNSQLESEPFNSEEDKWGRVKFKRPRCYRLRNILHNNHAIDKLSESEIVNSDPWDKWRNNYNNDLKKQFKKDLKIAACEVNDDVFKFYRNKFKTFKSFYDAIKLLRSWSIKSKGGLGSTFLFPSGPNCVYAEIQTSTNNIKSNILDGQGETLFSMLQRSMQHRLDCSDDFNAQLGADLYSKFFKQVDSIDEYAKVIQGVEESDRNISKDVKTEYLAYKHLPLFDTLYDDISNLMECALSKQDLFNALSIICMLHFDRFLLEQSKKMCQCYFTYLIESVQKGSCILNDDDPQISLFKALDSPEKIDAYVKNRFRSSIYVCINEKDKKLKTIVRERLGQNSFLLDQSFEYYIRHRFERYIDFTAPNLRTKVDLDGQDREILASILKASLFIDVTKETDVSTTLNNHLNDSKNYKEFLHELVKSLNERIGHKNNLHQTYCRYIGLVSGGAAKYKYYKFTDELLKTIIMASLGKSEFMELEKFTELLKHKYNIVIGDNVLNDCDDSTRQVLRDNFIELKKRLMDMNLLIALSDTSEYVRKP